MKRMVQTRHRPGHRRLVSLTKRASRIGWRVPEWMFPFEACVCVFCVCVRDDCHPKYGNRRPGGPTRPRKSAMAAHAHSAAGQTPLAGLLTSSRLLAPPLGVMKPLFGARRPDVAAARSRKPKLALLGTHDQFCTKERFNEWASTLAQPAAADIVYGREVVHSSCCGDQKCDSNHRRQLVHHFNVRVRPRRASRATTCVPRTLCS